MGYNCESIVVRNCLRNYHDFLFSVACLKGSCIVVCPLSDVFLHRVKEFTVTRWLCVHWHVFAFYILWHFFWLHMGTKGGRSLYFPISKRFHTPSLSPCLACGAEVSGFVCLKQLLAHQMFGSIIPNSHYLKFV